MAFHLADITVLWFNADETIKPQRREVGHARRLHDWKSFEALEDLPVELSASDFVVSLKPQIE